MSVHCDTPELIKKAKAILEATGAQDIASTSEAKADFGSTEHAQPRTLVSKL
jgi:hypothetical protein